MDDNDRWEAPPGSTTRDLLERRNELLEVATEPPNRVRLPTEYADELLAELPAHLRDEALDVFEREQRRHPIDGHLMFDMKIVVADGPILFARAHTQQTP